MSYEYSENKLVQDAAGKVLEELGWTVKLAYNAEVLGDSGTFGRKAYKEVLLTRYFRQALKKLNPWINNAQIEEAEKLMLSYLASASLMQINEEKYKLIRDGVPVAIRKPGEKPEEVKAKIIDFDNPSNNSFLALKEFWIWGDTYHRRTDIVGFVNGIPLLFIELKKNTVDVSNAYTDNYTDYLETIPQLFRYNAFIMFSNGVEAKVGTLGSKYEFFQEWKRLNENDKGKVALETMLRGICDKRNFLDLLENFILFDHSGGKTAKIMARNHQFLGVNEAIEAYKDRKLREGKLGVFWHTQGSGKSYSMVFLSQKIKRKFEGSPTILVLTDRDELNKQISDTFENCGMLGSVHAKEFIASSGSDLLDKLKGNPSFIFSLIQKFNHPEANPIYPDHDILIMSDEAHRSQYGKFAECMNKILPTASKIGFTGTPLLSSDNITERTFGGYVSVYDFKRAVDDGATVPLLYENRADKLVQTDNPEITDKILDAIEAADLDPTQEEKLEREFSKEIHLLTAEARLRSEAKDFVGHYSDLWTTGKAMMVCLNKVTCVRMFNYVTEYWEQEIEVLKVKIKNASQQEALELERKLQWMQETEMAVVISQEQNEVAKFKKWGLDILPHRKKMESRELDKEFKDPDNRLRIVFVCAMWLTGFDVKTLSCLYLDKPLKAHTLMQAIARANRVAEGKSNGLIIDYIGIVKALRKALADYTNSSKGYGTDPTIDKEKLIDRIKETLDKTSSFLSEQGFDLNKLIHCEDKEPFERLSLVLDAENAVCQNAETRKTFLLYANELRRLFKYLTREELTEQLLLQRDAIFAIYEALQKKRKSSDNTDLMVEINKIINDQIQVEEHSEGIIESKQFDISKIDFDMLRREFANSKRKNLIFKDIDELIQSELDKMLSTNPNKTRIDYYEHYQKLIDEYNNEQDRAAIEKTFNDLIDLANSMGEEQQRYVREGFSSEEELSIYDMLFSVNPSPSEIKKVKKVAKDLLAKIKVKLVELDHWRDKPETRSVVDNLIRDTLWEELPESYTDEIIGISRKNIYNYVFSHYIT